MYKVTLKNVGRDCVNKDFTLAVKTLGNVVAAAAGICASYMSGRSFDVLRIEDTEYGVFVDGVICGSLVIQRL